MQDRYIKASELRSFAFCERAWSFEGKGEASSLVAERAHGTQVHLHHGRAAVSAQAASRLANLLFFVGIVGVVAAVLWWVFHS